MTDPHLGDLLRRTPADLDPATADRILEEALASGARRRRTRRLGVAGGTALAVAAVAAVGAGLTGGGSADVSPDVAATSTPAMPAPSPSAVVTSYGPGSETEVPGGPVVATDRAVAGDATLLDAVRDLLPAGELADLDVTRTWSSTILHMADETRDGRLLSFSFDGAAASVTVQRWDGYAAVGVGNMAEMVESGGDAEQEQRVATTPAEACAGSYRSFPALDCRESAAGWYRVSRPSQGDAMPDTYRELYVSLFTDDGYVVTVDSYNTPAEKAGPPVAEQPVLSVPESLALATSDRWFVAK